MRIERRERTTKQYQLCDIPNGHIFSIGVNFPLFMKTDIREEQISKNKYKTIPEHICTIICDEDDRSKMETVLCIDIATGEGYMFPLGAGVWFVNATLTIEEQ